MYKQTWHRVLSNGINVMTVGLAVTALVKSVYINVPANMASGAC